MFTPGYNLATLRAHLLYLLEQHWRGGSSSFYQDAMLVGYLQAAMSEIYNQLKGWISREDSSVSLSSGSNRYALPSSVLGHGNYSLTLTLSNQRKAALVQRDWNYINRNYDVESPSTGTPVDYVLDPSDQRYILMFPAPATTGTLNVIYTPQSENLHRIWQPSAITCTVVNGSTTIVLSGELAEEEVSVGDQFGTIPTTQLDGSTLPDDPLPFVWYNIASLNDTDDEITLETPYQQVGASGLSFITAQRTLFERNMPGILGFTPAQLAAGMILETQSPQAADRLKKLAFDKLNNLPLGNRDFQPTGRRPARYLKNFFQ